mmetsp:Transcript_9387/g.28035  ORF Transcript_9387/g.28035 Transcript_9387/m.28035 type:complete len:84 (-) Transcript_9387:48-299(-)
MQDSGNCLDLPGCGPARYRSVPAGSDSFLKDVSRPSPPKATPRSDALVRKAKANDPVFVSFSMIHLLLMLLLLRSPCFTNVLL